MGVAREEQLANLWPHERKGFLDSYDAPGHATHFRAMPTNRRLAPGRELARLFDFCEREQGFEVKPQFRQCFSPASLPVDDAQSRERNQAIHPELGQRVYKSAPTRYDVLNQNEALALE